MRVSSRSARSARNARSAVVVGLTTIVAALAIAAPASAAPSLGFAAAKTRDVTCNLQLLALIPQPAATAANIGLVDCDRLGSGVQQDNSATTRTGPLTGSFTGPFTMVFKQGTVSGTFTIGFVTTVGGNPLHITGVTYDGTVTVTGGTGAYSQVGGGGTVTGFSPDAVTTNLVEHLTLTGV